MSEDRIPPPGWGAFCADETTQACTPEHHRHVEQATCVAYLRGFLDGEYADIRDDQCCVCYFEGFDWGEPLQDVEITIPLGVRGRGNESGADGS